MNSTRIYKKKINLIGTTYFEVRGFHYLLSSGFAFDRGTGFNSLFVWYLCDPTSHEVTNVSLHCFVTGETIPSGELDDKKFIGTHADAEQGLVIHVFAPSKLPSATIWGVEP